MNYRQIIGEAWSFTQENKKLIVWYAFIPSLLGTVVGAGYLVYQFYAFKSSALFDNWQESFSVVALKSIFDILKQNVGSAIPLTILAVIVAVLYFFLPPLTDGAMIQLIARKKSGQDVRIRDGLKFGLSYFLAMFNYSLVNRSINIISIMSEAGFVLRNLGPDTFDTLLPVLILLMFFSLFFMMMFTFTEYYIVIDDNHVAQSMAKSSVLVFKHWGKAFMISLLMFVIGIRILLQIIFVLLVPLGVLMGFFYFTASTLPDIAIWIGGVMGIAALLFASYLGAIVHVFTETVWVFAFMDLTTTPEINARGEVVEEGDKEEN